MNINKFTVKFLKLIPSSYIQKLNNGPAVLFLGQSTLSLNNCTNFFLEKINSKYKSSASSDNYNLDYNTILKLDFKNDYDSFSSWAENLCKNISTPIWLDSIAKVPWSNIFTSNIDTIIPRSFVNSWRKVQQIYSEEYKIFDPRNKYNLHLTHLYGCISQVEYSKRPPLNKIEKIKRDAVSTFLLRRLPEIITPKGILVIDGYDINTDWVEFPTLYGVISQLNIEQVLFCNFPIEKESDFLIQDLKSSNKIFTTQYSFSQIIDKIEEDKKFEFKMSSSDDGDGKWISIGDIKVKVPNDLIRNISKTVSIIDESLFVFEPHLNADDKYRDFKHFVGTTSGIPIWSSYAKGFAFKRECFEKLKNLIAGKIKHEEKNEAPIILFGQSSSGKTTTLGLLAYELILKFKVPVLFIEKRYSRIEETDIETFCKWAEDNGAKQTVVIWDGTIEPEVYYSLLRRLQTRGRKVVLVGSAYYSNKKNINKPNFIESSIELTFNEKKGFQNYLKTIDVLLANLIEREIDKNLLSMLYRYLPTTRTGIRTSLKEEFDFFSKKMREFKIDSNKNAFGGLYESLLKIGLVTEGDFLPFEESIDIDGEEVNIADQLFFLVMVPGQFGLNVPFELLLRLIGFSSFSTKIFSLFTETNLIIWSEDNQGNILLGARTATEAKILTNHLGSKKTQIEYIKTLLREIRSENFSSFGYESNSEIQFSVELLNFISPNTTDLYIDYLNEITEVLEQLRVNNQAYHPRLVLKEASFLRELVKYNRISPNVSLYDYLEKAESIVRNCLFNLTGYEEKSIHSFLKIELATILGTKTYQLLNTDETAEAKKTYAIFKEITDRGFVCNPENYNALDVVAWTTEILLTKNALNITDRVDAQAEMMSLFEMAELEGVSQYNWDKFNDKKLRFYQAIGADVLADDLFEHLKANRSTTGFYLKAKNLIGYTTLENNDLDNTYENYKKAYYFLEENFEYIKSDGKCLFLLFKCWWINKTKKHFFIEEKQTVPFFRPDWEYCLKIVESLLFLGDKFKISTAYYFKGLAEFHLGYYRSSLETFRMLDYETDTSSYGKRRIIKAYLYSNSDGKPRVFSGEVKNNVSILKHEKIGEIYVSEIREYIPFILNEFGNQIYQKGELIEKFNIGFNFRGPIAVPIKPDR